MRLRFPSIDGLDDDSLTLLSRPWSVCFLVTKNGRTAMDMFSQLMSVMGQTSCRHVLKAAVNGSVQGCVAGPPCRTSSACRMAADGGPRQLCAREGLQRYGLDRNDPTEQDMVFQDNVLRFRTIVYFLVLQACCPCKPYLGWEHPEDPACWSTPTSPLQHCSCVWVFPEMHSLRIALQAWLCQFDQGALGHAKRKPTCVMTTSWFVYESLHEVRGSGQGDSQLSAHPPSRKSKYESAEWACWAPGLVSVLKEGWRQHVHQPESVRIADARGREQALRALSPEWPAHVSADHVPKRRDCEVCLQAASRGRLHYKHPHSAFYALSSDICGPFAPGKDVGGKKKYFGVFTMRVPVISDFPWNSSGPLVPDPASASLPVAAPSAAVESGTPEEPPSCVAELGSEPGLPAGILREGPAPASGVRTGCPLLTTVHPPALPARVSDESVRKLPSLHSHKEFTFLSLRAVLSQMYIGMKHALLAGTRALHNDTFELG